MIPESFGTLAAFLLFVAPGLLTDLKASKRTTRGSESAFHELSRIVFSSLVFTLIAGSIIALIFYVCMLVCGYNTANLIREASRKDFVSTHRLSVGLFSLLTAGLACILVHLWDKHVSKRNTSNFIQMSAWHQVFHETPIGLNSEKNQTGTLIYVRIRLSNGYTYLGCLNSYSQSLEIADREIVISQPIFITPPNCINATLVGKNWQRMIFHGKDIISLSVRYDSEL